MTFRCTKADRKAFATAICGDLKEALSDAQKECWELRQTIQILDQKGKENLP